jgi:hypothetical protein
MTDLFFDINAWLRRLYVCKVGVGRVKCWYNGVLLWVLGDIVTYFNLLMAAFGRIKAIKFNTNC